jgi:hypothetical protein
MTMKRAVAIAFALGATPLIAQDEILVADEAAAFTAAGFVERDGQWIACADDATESYRPGSIEQVLDANGDGLPEAVISEGSTFCYGMEGAGYFIVSRQVDGSWKTITSGSGIPIFLETRGSRGWADLAVGGPGFCFPVLRWNGSEYAFNRYEYEGKRCSPG